ncbi:MAG: hypothetical protein MUE54_02495 [Anaerolineae bacterium]|nr:hypothetical protein [Anaerolineae bacterium]
MTKRENRMSKSALSPQSRNILYIGIAIFMFIGVVVMILSVGQQLNTLIDPNITPTPALSPTE